MSDNKVSDAALRAWVDYDPQRSEGESYTVREIQIMRHAFLSGFKLNEGEDDAARDDLKAVTIERDEFRQKYLDATATLTGLRAKIDKALDPGGNEINEPFSGGVIDTRKRCSHCSGIGGVYETCSTCHGLGYL